MENVTISIVCDVFNHEPYLRQCLDGFVMQKTDFPFEILISDDASTDKSADIIKEYVSKSPSLFKPIYQSENQFSQGVGIWSDIQFPRATGKYIAICEGDDFWTDPLKLQKQVDILEADESLMACCTNSSLVDKEGTLIEEKLSRPVVPDNREGKYTLREFFEQNHTYPTASMVFRRTHFDEICEKFRKTRNPFLGDWTLWIAILCFGNMYYLDEVTCAYRINPTSVTHSKVDERRLGLAKANFKILPAVASILPEEGFEDIKDDLRYNTAWLWFQLANAYRHLHKYFHMAGCILICGIQNPKYLYSKLRNRK